MRALKVVFNVAISRNSSLIECYPFSSKRAEKSKFRIKNAARKKGEALNIDQLRKFIAFNAMPGTSLWEAKAIWLFSLYAQGMNFRDFCFLKKGNISESTLSYIRSKTKNSKTNEEKIRVPISSPLKEILNHQSITEDGYWRC